MRTYEELMEIYCNNGGPFTDEECQYIDSVIYQMLREGKMLDYGEIQWLLEGEYDSVLLETGNHGWEHELIIVQIGPDEYYSFKCWYHDDRGYEEFEAQVCPRVMLRPTVKLEWTEAPLNGKLPQEAIEHDNELMYYFNKEHTNMNPDEDYLGVYHDERSEDN